MTETSSSQVFHTFDQICVGCGHVTHTVRGIAQDEHEKTCQRLADYMRGWHSGYRQAAENPADPMVQRDRVEYGTGWAGVMDAGGIVIEGC